LDRVPENMLKFVVGVLLTSFGVFWGAEGAGASWPGSDAALPIVITTVAVVALLYTWALRQLREWSQPVSPESPRPIGVPK
jgi:uncharacterized membrane protein